jgi:predicted nucleotidyltransferase
MLTKEQIASKLRDHYPYFAEKFGLKRIALFGSYVLGTQNDQSDIDILAEFERPIGLKFIEFAEYIESLFSKKADVITAAGLQSIRNSSIAKSIEETLEYV